MPLQGRFSVAMAGSLLVASSLFSVASSLAFQRSSCGSRRLSSVQQGFQCRPQMALFGDEKSVSEYSDFIEVDEADFAIAADNDDEDDDDDQELLVLDEDEQLQPAEEVKAPVDPDSFVFIPKAKAAPQSSSSQSTPRPKSQFAALAPGTVVHIKVGDISLARKAWKKRRRSGSPLLVPCSVLNVDRQSTVRWNLIYLLEKFGTSTSGQGIRISLGELARRQRTHLKSSLTQQAEAMGFASARELVENLLNKKAQETYGVKLVYINNDDGVITSDGGDGDTESNTLAIEAPLSRFRAQKRANEAAILQFGDEDQKEDTLQHTGIVRNRRQVSEEDGNMYQLQPLSAALRVNQEDVDTGHIQDGSMHAAVVFTYDSQGDGGAPMLTLSLNPGRNQVRDRLKIAPSDHKYTPILNPKYMLKELKAGDGPIEGKVIRFVKGGALLDCGVGRKVNNRDVPDPVRVFGLLRFKDALAAASGDDPRYDFSKFVDDDVDYDDDVEEEDWDEILNIDDLDLDRDLDEDDEDDVDESESTQENDDGNAELSSEDDEAFIDSEDITHFFTTNADGSLTYTDPETGEINIVNNADEDDEEFDDEDGGDNGRENYRINRDSETTGKDYRPKRPAFKAATGLKSKRLNVGDRVEVFVKGVSKQSNQLMVTMNPSVQGMTAKDLKRETGLSKKLNRLAKQIGGMHRIRELQGQECDGVVKATSVAGDWLYVQPTMDSLPVGVATVPADLYANLTKGDKVRIQLQGVDEDRGQLAMLILKKL